MPKGYLVANIRVKDTEKFQSFSGIQDLLYKSLEVKYLLKGQAQIGMRVKLMG